MTSAAESPVRCPECGEEYDPTFADGWCPNFDCGEYRHPSFRETTPNADGATASGTACPTCGESASRGANYCPACGTQLPDSQPPAPGHSDDTAAVFLEVADAAIEAEPDVPVGREIRRAIVADGVPRREARRIHREHVRVEYEGSTETYYVRHVGEASVRVNGAELEPGSRTEITDRDRIELSDTAALTVRIAA
jgi:hypothetical protein